MKDLLLKLLEMTEVYHEQKEKKAWIASTIYFAFAITIINWLLGENKGVIADCPILATVVISMIFVIASLFVFYQFKLKFDSVKIGDVLREALFRAELDETYYTRLKNDTIQEKKIWPEMLRQQLEKEKHNLCWIIKDLTELPIYALMILFLILQLYFIWK